MSHERRLSPECVAVAGSIQLPLLGGPLSRSGGLADGLGAFQGDDGGGGEDGIQPSIDGAPDVDHT